MAYATLVGLRLQSRLGFIQRDVIVPESITVFNLHKVLQFALNCRQTDDGIASKRFVFKHGDKEVKAQKTTKLYHAAGRGAECVPGTAYTYQCGDGNDYVLTVTQVGCGDARYYIPCLTGGFGGSINIDGTNKKLMVRRFSAATARLRRTKQPPKVWCSRGTPREEIMASHLAMMRHP